MTVRISATDWVDGGIDVDDAVEIARAFAEHGADGIDVSTGQVRQRRAAGLRAQLPDAVRRPDPQRGRPIGVPTIAVGAISSYDDVNSILLAGRADLCALGRTHLYDPHWTLHAAAEQDYAGPGATWPMPFAAGSRRPQTGRTDGPRPRLELIRAGVPGTAHARWRPGGRGGPRGWPVTAFALTSEQQDFAERVRDLASGQLRALAEAGTPGQVNRELIKAMGDLGLLARLVSRCRPGGLSREAAAMDLCLLREALATQSTEAETALALQGLGSYPSCSPGGRRSSRRWLPAVAAGDAVAAFALTEPERRLRRRRAGAAGRTRRPPAGG